MTSGAAGIAAAPERLRDVRRRGIREHVTRHAVDLFSRNGFHATSMGEIAAAAGTTKPTLYAYFPSKEEILSDVQAAMWRTIGDTYRDFGALAEWSRDSVAGWLADTVAVWRRDRDSFRACMSVQQAKIDAEHAHYHREFVGFMMRNELLWSRFPDDRAEVRASLLLRMTEAFLTSWLLRDWPVDEDLVSSEMVSVWLDVLGVQS